MKKKLIHCALFLAGILGLATYQAKHWTVNPITADSPFPTCPPACDDK